MDFPLPKIIGDNLGAIIPFATFVLGWFGARWTMTKKERKDFEQKLFENGRDLMVAQQDRFQEFAATLAKYINKDGEPTFADFVEISTVGEKLLYQQKIVSDAILSGKVDTKTRDNTLLPSIIETVDRTLPNYYNTLRSIAKRRGFDYEGELRRANYESLYVVVEKYRPSISSDPHGAANIP